MLEAVMLVRSLLDSSAYQIATPRHTGPTHFGPEAIDSVSLSNRSFTDVLQEEARAASDGSHKAAAAVNRLALDEGLKKARRNAAKSARPRHRNASAPRPKVHKGWIITGC